jgi:hypothetical protein
MYSGPLYQPENALTARKRHVMASFSRQKVVSQQKFYQEDLAEARTSAPRCYPDHMQGAHFPC